MIWTRVVPFIHQSRFSVAYSCCCICTSCPIPAYKYQCYGTTMLPNSPFNLHHLSASFVDGTDCCYVGGIVGPLHLSALESSQHFGETNPSDWYDSVQPQRIQSFFFRLRQVCSRSAFDDAGYQKIPTFVDYSPPASDFG